MRGETAWSTPSKSFASIRRAARHRHRCPSRSSMAMSSRSSSVDLDPDEARRLLQGSGSSTMRRRPRVRPIGRPPPPSWVRVRTRRARRGRRRRGGDGHDSQRRGHRVGVVGRQLGWGRRRARPAGAGPTSPRRGEAGRRGHPPGRRRSCRTSPMRSSHPMARPRRLRRAGPSRRLQPPSSDCPSRPSRARHPAAACSSPGSAVWFRASNAQQRSATATNPGSSTTVTADPPC